LLRGEIIVVFTSALRTDRTIWPTKPRNCVDTDLLIRKVAGGVPEGLGLFGSHAKSIPNFLWLVKYIIALNPGKVRNRTQFHLLLASMSQTRAPSRLTTRDRREQHDSMDIAESDR